MGVNKKKKNRLHFNNHGSTLITVLVVVAFIAILGTTTTSMAMISYKMKTVDKKAKSTFYTAEKAVDEIHAGLGKASMEALNQAYTKEMAEVIKIKDVGGTESTIRESNTTLNLELRKEFTKGVVDELTGTSTWSTSYTPYTLPDKNIVINKLNSYITGYVAKVAPTDPDSPVAVKSITSAIVARVDNPESAGGTGIDRYVLTIKDCMVDYHPEGTDTGYVATVTFDCAIEIPDTVVNFTESPSSIMAGELTTYSVIGNTGIYVDEGSTLTVPSGGSIYGGGGSVSLGSSGGINLRKNSTLNATAGAFVVSRGDITVDSATFNASGSSTELWCTNLIAKNSANLEALPQITIADASTYVKDDLEIDGDGLGSGIGVKIGGDYYGYGYEGTNTSSKHTNSSSIIINGTKSALDLRNLGTLVLGGRAYIDFTSGGYSSNTYRTGQSLSLQGDQEVYLVPSTMVKNASDSTKNVGNPVTSGISYTVDATQFFGYTCLDSSSPVKAVTVGSETYLYFNFKDREAEVTYFKAILDDATYETLKNVGGATTNATLLVAYNSTRSYMKTVLENNMKSLSQSILNPNSSSNVYTNGGLYEANLSTSKVTNSTSSTMAPDTFKQTATDLTSRYTCLCRKLYRPDWGTKLTNANEVSSLSASMFENIINMSYLNKMISSPYGQSIYGNCIKAVVNGNITINDGSIKGGVVVATGNITVDVDEFHGLLIAQGSVIFTHSNTKVYSDLPTGQTVENFIKESSGFNLNFEKYFLKFNTSTVDSPSGIPFAIADITYSDIVNFTKWSKQ